MKYQGTLFRRQELTIEFDAEDDEDAYNRWADNAFDWLELRQSEVAVRPNRAGVGLDGERDAGRAPRPPIHGIAAAVTDEQFIAAAAEAGLHAEKVPNNGPGPRAWIVTRTYGARQVLTSMMVEQVDIPSTALPPSPGTSRSARRCSTRRPLQWDTSITGR